MLNYTLFNKLESLVGEGEVDVSRENDPGTIVSGQKSHRLRIHGGEQYLIRCPVCEDTHKKRLAFSYLCGQTVKTPNFNKPAEFSPYMYRCVHKECQRYQPLREWVKNSGIYDLGVVDLVQQDVQLKKKKMFELYKTEDMKLPLKLKPLMSPEVPDSVIDYIHERGFSPDYLTQDFGVLYAPPGTSYQDANGDDKEFFDSSLIIPITGRRRLKGWQARSMNPDAKLRYLTGPGSDLTNLLYNMDQAKFYQGCVIAEGAVDVWRAHQLKDKGISSVGLLSKGMNSERLKILKTLWGYCHNWGAIMLDSKKKDPNAPEEAEKIAKQLKKENVFPNGMVIAHLSYGDPAEFSAEELFEFIKEGVVV